ncbi:MAG: hypothetical protein OXD31_01285 [Chloroflexi bacterium]|nr:hypothetical protein [Chloroflexota bacterium]
MTSAKRGTYSVRISAISGALPGVFKGALAGAIVGITVASVLVLIDSVVWNTLDLFSGELPRDSALMIALRIGRGAITGVLVGSIVGAVVGGRDMSNRFSGAVLRASISSVTAILVAYLFTKAIATLLSYTLSNFPDVIGSRSLLLTIFYIIVVIIILGCTTIGLFVGIPSDYYGGKRRNGVKIVLAGVVAGVVPMIASVMLAPILFDL